MERKEDVELKEEYISSKKIFEGSILQLQVDTVRLPHGKTATRELVKHPGAVVVLPLTEEQELVLVKQYRYAAGEILLELPAGKRDEGEDPLICARRELKEETGYSATEMKIHSAFYTCPGFSDELIYLIIAKGLVEGEPCPDEGEFIDVLTLPLEKAVRMVLDGEIKDAKTAYGILLCRGLEE